MTTQYSIYSDDPLEMVWAIREKIYEETKEMTPQEFTEYIRKGNEDFNRKMAEVNPADYDFSFLNKK